MATARTRSRGYSRGEGDIHSSVWMEAREWALVLMRTRLWMDESRTPRFPFEVGRTPTADETRGWLPSRARVMGDGGCTKTRDKNRHRRKLAGGLTLTSKDRPRLIYAFGRHAK